MHEYLIYDLESFRTIMQSNGERTNQISKQLVTENNASVSSNWPHPKIDYFSFFISVMGSNLRQVHKNAQHCIFFSFNSVFWFMI